MLKAIVEKVKGKYFRKTLTYTEEMRKQDELWDIGKEDLKKMEELHRAITNEAYDKGFEGVIRTYVIKGSGSEVITEAFPSEFHLEYENLHGLGDLYIAHSSNCKKLIEDLERLINYPQSYELDFANLVFLEVEYSRAVELFRQDKELYLLHDDGSESLVENLEDLIEHHKTNGLFGVEIPGVKSSYKISKGSGLS